MHTFTLNDWFVGDECGKTKHKQITDFSVRALLPFALQDETELWSQQQSQPQSLWQTLFK